MNSLENTTDTNSKADGEIALQSVHANETGNANDPAQTNESTCVNGAATKSETGILQQLSSCYVVWAFLALIAVDMVCQLSWHKLSLDHFASANRSMIWWAVDDFKHQKKTPDVVLLGSSLLMHVLHGGDAEYLKLPQNEVYHHKSLMLEDLLRKRTGVKINSFAFAVAGTMASDAYALSSTLFAQDQKPKAIIYGIAPRDFIDNTLASPASTETFRLMSQAGGVKDVGWQAHTGIWEKAEFALEEASSLYKHRNFFVHLQHHYAKPLLKIAGYKNNDEVHTPFALRRLSLLEMPEDIGSNERIALPGLAAHYTDNSDEYRRRYQPFKQKEFTTQCAYLEKLLSFCDQQGIEIVLVNMPLTADNLKLLTPGAYELYKQTVSSLAGKYHSQFIDMQDTTVFDKSLYCDTAHMTGCGGVKFFNLLSEKLTDGSHLAIGKSGSWQ